MVDQETGERGFLITGRQEFLQPFEAGKTNLKLAFKNLRLHVNSNFHKQTMLDNIEQVRLKAAEWLEKAAIPEIAMGQTLVRYASPSSDLFFDSRGQCAGRAVNGGRAYD